MIIYLRGKITFTQKKYVVLETKDGVGYQVFMTEVALGHIAQNQDEAEIFVHTDVKEDHIELYGFETMEELELFKLLLSISGVGPKAGLSILTIASAQTVHSAILNEDVKLLTSVPGIGKKTAQRIVLELKNKIEGLPLADFDQQNNVHADQEVIEALLALGYNAAQAREALNTIPKEITDISEKLKWALKKM